MRILAVSDLHFNRNQLDWLVRFSQEDDVVVIAGDLLDIAGRIPVEEQIREVGGYLRKLSGHCLVIASSGNHDGECVLAEGEAWAKWLRGQECCAASDLGGVTLGGCRFSVCPWWNGPVVRGEMVSFLEEEQALSCDRWYWVHHAPPRGSSVAWTRKGNAGDPYLQKLVNRYRPDLVFSGHIHEAPFYAEGSWFDRLGKTIVFNTGKQPGDSPAHIRIDTEKGTIRYFSMEGVSELALEDERLEIGV